NDAIKFWGESARMIAPALFFSSESRRSDLDQYGRLSPCKVAGGHADTRSADRLAPVNISRIAHVLVKKRAVGLANRCRVVVVNEWQEGVAAAARDFGHRVQERARKHHGATRQRLEALWSVFGKADLPAFEIGVQVDRRREAAMGR